MAGVYSYVPSGFITTVPPPAVVIVTAAAAAVAVAGSTIVSVSVGLASLSFSDTSPVTAVFNSVPLVSSSATGAGSIIRNVIVAVSALPLPSSIVYGTCTVPTKPGSGVNVVSPVIGSTSSVPCVTPVTGSTIVIGPVDGSIPSTSVIVTVSPFGSVSFANRFAVAI